MERFDPSCLKRELRRRGIRSADLYTHGFPLAAPELARRLGIREGGSVRLAFTAVGPTLWVIELKRGNFVTAQRAAALRYEAP